MDWDRWIWSPRQLQGSGRPRWILLPSPHPSEQQESPSRLFSILPFLHECGILIIPALFVPIGFLLSLPSSCLSESPPPISVGMIKCGFPGHFPVTTTPSQCCCALGSQPWSACPSPSSASRARWDCGSLPWEGAHGGVSGRFWIQDQPGACGDVTTRLSRSGCAREGCGWDVNGAGRC